MKECMRCEEQARKTYDLDLEDPDNLPPFTPTVTFMQNLLKDYKGKVNARQTKQSRTQV